MKRVIGLYNGFQFFFGLLIWLPIFYEYQKRIGLSDTEIFAVQSFYYAIFCVLDIPTGILGDRWGYRRVLQLGAIAMAVSNLLPIFAQSYVGFLGHFLLIAVARSLTSGSSSAYLYDYMKAHGAADEYKQAEGRARALSLVGKLAIWPSVGWLMELHLTIPYWITVAGTSFSVYFAFALPALAGEGVTTETRENSLLANLRGVGSLLTSTPYLAFLMLQGVAVFVLARIVVVNLFQPILGSKSIELAAYGMMMSAMTIFELIGSARPQWMRRWTTDLQAVFLLSCVMAVSMAAIPFVGRVGTVASLCVFALACGLSFPIQRQLLNDAIVDSRYRATILSIESVLDRAVCAWVAMVLGGYLKTSSVSEFLSHAAVVTLVAMACLFGIMRFSGLKHFDIATGPK